VVTKEMFYDIAERLFKEKQADHAELQMISHDKWLTRFADNAIHQNVNEVQQQFSVRVAIGGKYGSASVESPDFEQLGRALKRATEHARLSPENPNHVGLPETGEAACVCAKDCETAQMTAADRANAVLEITRRADARDVLAHGYYSSCVRQVGVANSLGVRAYHEATEADCVAIAVAPGCSGYARALSLRKSEVCPKALAETAISKCVEGRNPRPLEAGDYEVVLEEEAAAELLTSLGMAFDARAVSEGRSLVAHFVGKKVLGDNISVVDDGHCADGLPLPFDFEGRPRKRLELVKNGVIKDLVHDAASAQKAGTEATGHAVPSFARVFGVSAVPMHLFVAPGNSDIHEMVRNTKRGILITRLWYNRLVHPIKTLITGMTRDGTFYIEDGEIKYPILNMRYTQSVVEALNNVEELSETTKLRSVMGYGSIRVPAMKIGKFTFTGTTEH